jgi:dTDP-4-dehydrorhamnose 3,5-epimerase
MTPLKRIKHPKGDIYHALKANESSCYGFGEAYFTTILCGETKGWKKHLRMTLNLVVPVGGVCFYLHNDKVHESIMIEIGENNYQRLTINPGIWVAFRGIGDGLNLVLNVANILHDQTESINVPIETYSL